MYRGGHLLREGLKAKRLIATSSFICHFHLRRFLLFSTATVEQHAPLHLANGDLYKASISSPSSSSSFLANYLINSWGFSPENAETVAATLGKLNTIHKPYAVLHSLREFGFDDGHIKRLVVWRPKLLVANVDRTLKPKLKVFQDLGFSSNETAKLIVSNSGLLVRSFAPSVEFLRTLFCRDEDVVKVIKRLRFVLSRNVSREMPRSISILQKNGVPERVISRLIQLHPCYLLHDPDWLERQARKVVELGINPSSGIFVYALRTVCSLSESTWNAKVDAFKSFGWTEVNVACAFCTTPSCFSMSEANIRSKLEFFMNQLKFDASLLASRSNLLCLSLEKRIIPRYKFCEEFNSKKIRKKDLPYATVVLMSETEFRNRYILPYKDAVPHICEAYVRSVGAATMSNDADNEAK